MKETRGNREHEDTLGHNIWKSAMSGCFFYCGENAAGVHGETMKPPHGGGIDKQTKGDRDEEMVDGGGDGAADGV